MQKLMSQIRRAIDEYGMISAGDRIAVGVSGGKDSLMLLYALAQIKRFYPKPFDLCAITLDMGFEGTDFSPVAALCGELGIAYVVKQTAIKEVVFDIRQEKNPCALCANLRRGALNAAALENGCRKVALGHHHDDVLETFFLSLLYEGRVGCFSPVTYLDRKGIYLIRPMIYVAERDVLRLSKRHDLPVVHNPCPANGNTKRQEVKELIASFAKADPDVKTRLFTAVQQSAIPGWAQRVMIHRKPVVREQE